MTYTYNDQAVHEAVAGGKVIIRRPIGMSDKKWIKYAEGVVKALDNRAPCTPLERGESLHKAAKLMMVEAVNACLAESVPSMKLVDILARELKVWPEGCSHIVQDHDGQCWPSAGDISSSKIFYGKEWSTDTDGVVEFYSEIASDFGSAKVTRAEWQAAVDALKAADSKPDTARATEARGQAKDELYTLGALIEMGYLRPTDRIETPSYDFSAWPPERFDCGLLPSLYVQSFGRVKRHQPVDLKPKSTAQENTEFLEARVKLLEAELAERREEANRTIEFVLTPSALRALQIGIPVLRIRDNRKMIVRVEG